MTSYSKTFSLVVDSSQSLRLLRAFPYNLCIDCECLSSASANKTTRRSFQGSAGVSINEIKGPVFQITKYTPFIYFWLFVCLPVCLYVCLYVYVFKMSCICLLNFFLISSVCPFTSVYFVFLCLSVSLCASMTVYQTSISFHLCLSFFLSACLSIYICLFSSLIFCAVRLFIFVCVVVLSAYLSDSPSSVCLSLYLSVSLCISLSVFASASFCLPVFLL